LAVICKAKGDLFLNPSLTRFHDYVRMGVRLPLLHTNSKVAQVSIPWRRRDGTLSEKAAYLRKAAVHRGFFPYTARNIIRQSFELLNAPYGWGGMHGEQDCSRFVQQVFATVGIALPRNSQHQGRTGCLLGAFRDSSSMVERRHVLSQRAVGGITLLGMKGHIMLFLGTVGHQPYVIHAAFAYREPARWGDINRVVNRVVISDLSLGKGTRRGSLLERLKSVRMVSSPAGCRP
jgi:hypothetical protein